MRGKEVVGERIECQDPTKGHTTYENPANFYIK